MIYNKFDATEEEGEFNQNRIHTRSWNTHVLITVPTYSCFVCGKWEKIQNDGSIFVVQSIVKEGCTLCAPAT